MCTEAQQRKVFSASIDYISASANRHSRVAHSSASSLVAFGSGSFVALWSAAEGEDAGIFRTLPGHDGLVTCVRFREQGDLFFSADDKGTVRCWEKISDEWSTTCIQQAHTKSVTALGVFGKIVVTGSSDAHIAVWSFSESSFGGYVLDEVQRIDMKGRYPFDIQITSLPESANLIMAVASTERNISLFVRSEDTGKFIRAASLSGHEDWVKSLSFQHGVAEFSVLTLASGSQDGTIRLWNIEKISKNCVDEQQKSDSLTDELLDSFEASLGETTDGEEGGRQISMKRHILTVKTESESSAQYSVTFDALLVGHEAGVTSIVWRPSSLTPLAHPMLMSTSTDSSVIFWAPSFITGSSSGVSASLWINQQRFGDIGGQRLGGFVGGIWIRDGSEALAWGWAGGWRRWKSIALSDESSDIETWKEISAISGHNGPVRGVSWSPLGEYLISTGPDQTSRIHADVSEKDSGKSDCWHEICRPQVHGYDLVDAVFLSTTRFVSIADEKVARVFDAPKSFVSFCKHIGVLMNVDENERPMAATVPPLGLSNKALSATDSTEAHFPLPSPSMTQRRPFEGELSISTLWPEIEKVFGHGYELHAIAASHSGRFVATACRATTPEHAGIKVYDTRTWQIYGQTLLGHQLTVTRIAFSPDDRYILSVSRDRSWIIHEAGEEGYVPIAADKSHARIIWDCAWSPEGDIFVTASRDKTVKIWGTRTLNEAQKQLPLATIKAKDAVTALAISYASPSSRRLLALGIENGGIIIYSSENDPKVWNQEFVLDNSIAHIAQVHRLEWRPRSHLSAHQLASCSEDGTIRIIRLCVGE